MVIAPVIASMFLSAVPKVGDLAPNFSVNDTDGKNRTLSALVSQGPVIVAFFPKAFTAGWTREFSAYRDRYADVEKAKAQVLAISMDDAETLKRFKEELKTPFAFIADPQGKIVDQYDVKGAVAMAKRYTFVVGQDRKIVDVQSGADAVDPLKSIAACPLHKDKSPAKTKSTEVPKKG